MNINTEKISVKIEAIEAKISECENKIQDYTEKKKKLEQEKNTLMTDAFLSEILINRMTFNDVINAIEATKKSKDKVEKF